MSIETVICRGTIMAALAALAVGAWPTGVAQAEHEPGAPPLPVLEANEEACPFPTFPPPSHPLALPMIDELPAVVEYPDAPPLTDWRPEGVRGIPDSGPVLGRQNIWRQRHGDVLNNDEMTTAVGPSYDLDWESDPNEFYTIAASFDEDGNLYGQPVYSYTNAIIQAYDGETGEHTWDIELTPGVDQTLGTVPITFLNPETDEQRVVGGTRGEVLVTTIDGDIVWRKPTGLSPLPPEATDDNFGNFIFWGPNYNSAADGFVFFTGDGEFVMLDRQTGENILAEPFVINGSPAPRRGGLLAQECQDHVDAALGPGFTPLAPPGITFVRLIEFILGEGVVGANNFSVIQSGPNAGMIPMSATAPDEADGTVDGISENGATVVLDTVPVGDGTYNFVERCRLEFEGGSATTTSCAANGLRCYTADAIGQLLALDLTPGAEDPETGFCRKAWELAAPTQVVASPSVANDNNEVYLGTFNNLVQVIDNGESGEIGWLGDIQICEPPEGVQNFRQGQLVSAPIGSNRMGIMGGCGPLYLANPQVAFIIPLRIGATTVDRLTGDSVGFELGFEESTALTIYDHLGNLFNPRSPTRSIFVRLFYPHLSDATVKAGIARYKPRNLANLFREGAHAAKNRERRAHQIRSIQPEGTSADLDQTEDQIVQMQTLAPQAVGSGDVTSDEWAVAECLIDEVEKWHGKFRNGQAKNVAIVKSAENWELLQCVFSDTALLDCGLGKCEKAL